MATDRDLRPALAGPVLAAVGFSGLGAAAMLLVALATATALRGR